MVAIDAMKAAMLTTVSMLVSLSLGLQRLADSAVRWAHLAIQQSVSGEAF